jgi:putative tricarboxylic transport membrane protein
MEEKSQRPKKVTSLVLFGLSLFYLVTSFRLKLGTPRNPGPGLIPMAIGVLLLILTMVYLIRVFGEKSPRPQAKAGEITVGAGKNYRGIIGILACTLVYPLILESLKFLVSTFAVAFAMLFILKPQRAILAVILALVLAVGSFVIFSLLLGVALPSGFLETLFFRIGG